MDNESLYRFHNGTFRLFLIEIYNSVLSIISMDFPLIPWPKSFHTLPYPSKSMTVIDGDFLRVVYNFINIQNFWNNDLFRVPCEHPSFTTFLWSPLDRMPFYIHIILSNKTHRQFQLTLGSILFYLYFIFLITKIIINYWNKDKKEQKKCRYLEVILII